MTWATSYRTMTWATSYRTMTWATSYRTMTWATSYRTMTRATWWCFICPCTTTWSSKIQHLFFVIRNRLNIIKKCECKITTNEVIVSVEMFLRYSIKISSWLLLTVASFNFDRYQFSNDLFILLFYKRWSGTIPQTTKVSIHSLPFFFQFTKIEISTYQN
jgi:hypothetical protein